MRAAILTENQFLAASLAEALLSAGLTVPSVNQPQTGRDDVLVVDAAWPGLTQPQLVELRCSAYLVVVTGWWDARDPELRPHVDFVLNAPLREWQLTELWEDLGRRQAQAEKQGAVRVA